jgi:CHAD domain-containing protein
MLDVAARAATGSVDAVTMERELKLAAPMELTRPDLDGLSGLRGDAPVVFELSAAYYDTRDLTLARSGVTLRYRSGEPGPPWTVKLPAAADGTLLSRQELSFAGDPDTMPARVRDLVRGYVGSRRLRCVARLDTHRTLIRFRDVDGAASADLVDDVVTTSVRDEPTGQFREIEFELAADAKQPRRLQRAAARRLIAAGCQAEPPIPKLVRALGERAQAAPDLVVVPVGAKAATAELVRHALTAAVLRMQQHDAGLRLGDDPEDLHQFRVAARTLRSDLQTFGAVLEDEWAHVIRSELGWLVTEVGRVRDLDVLRERLVAQTHDLPPDDASGVEALLATLQEQTDRARAAMLTALRSHRYDSLIAMLVRGAREPAFAPDAPVWSASSARRTTRDAVRHQYRHLQHAVAACSEPATDVELHRIRIAAKRSRYAMEAARPILGAVADATAAAMADLQTVLGDWHDTTVAEQWLRGAAHERPRCALVAGELIAVQRQDGRRLRAAWRTVWEAIDTKEHRRAWR